MLRITDTGFISALNRGEQQAYALIFHHYAGPVRYFVEQLITDRQAAEDITSETFIRAFRKYADFATLDKLKAFLYITANNAALDYLKTTKRHQQAHEEINYLSTGRIDDAELAYIRSETARSIHAAIDALPQQSAKVIRLLFIEGKTMQETAELLGVSYHTVKNHRARGLELIRLAIQKNTAITSTGLLIALSLLDYQ